MSIFYLTKKSNSYKSNYKNTWRKTKDCIVEYMVVINDGHGGKDVI
jgi:hypothetical protein